MTGALSLQATDLHRYYQVGRGVFKQPATLKAVAGASFMLEPGKTLAVVGESGCGKSTLARLVTMIEPPTSGRLAIDGREVTDASPETLRALRPAVQMVFQDPYGSLNPRKQVGAILEEPLEINTRLDPAERRTAARDMMAKVGLRPEYYSRYPHMFSGGQRQRIAIARAVVRDSPILILDEPSSALDSASEKLVFDALDKLMLSMTSIVIAHRLSTIQNADVIFVVKDGSIVETGAHDDLMRLGGYYAELHDLQFRDHAGVPPHGALAAPQ